jgi:hypothetical protein
LQAALWLIAGVLRRGEFKARWDALRRDSKDRHELYREDLPLATYEGLHLSAQTVKELDRLLDEFADEQDRWVRPRRWLIVSSFFALLALAYVLSAFLIAEGDRVWWGSTPAGGAGTTAMAIMFLVDGLVTRLGQNALRILVMVQGAIAVLLLSAAWELHYRSPPWPIVYCLLVGASVGVAAAFIWCALRARIVGALLRWQRTRHIDAVLASGIVRALWLVCRLDTERAPADVEHRRVLVARLVRRLEDVAVDFERGLAGSIDAGDGETRRWFAASSGRMAAGVRRLKRDVMLPPQGSLDTTKRRLTDLLQAVLSGRWGDVAIADPEADVRSRLASAALQVAGVLIGVAPLALFAMWQLFSHAALSLERATPIWTVTAIWAVSSVAARLDPTFDRKADSVPKLSSLLLK